MPDNPLIVEELEEQVSDLANLQDSSTPCPRCQTLLKVVSTNDTPDNFVTGLICPNCQWFEED